MNTIYLYDVSAMVKSGNYSSVGAQYGKPKRDYNFFSFPTGGLYTFTERFMTDYNSAKPGDVFIACFDGQYDKYYRRQIYSAYKQNRSIDGFDNNTQIDKNDVNQLNTLLNSLPANTREKVIRRTAANIQIKLLRMILPKMGVNVLYAPDMEADDWIYSMCYAFGQSYKIVLRADDGDLEDCINYAPHLRMYSVMGRQEITPTPGKNFFKIFKGEKSDNIPNLRSLYNARNMDALMNAILNGLELPTVLSDREKLKNDYHLLDEEVDAIELNVKLVTPVIRLDVELMDEPLNAEQIGIFFSALRFKKAIGRLGMDYIESEEVTNLQKFAFSLLPDYVKEFYKEKEFVDSSVNRAILENAMTNQSNTESYLLEAASKYNIL